MARYTSLDPEKFYRIREAALQLFYENGIEKTSINEIAKKAGIAKGTIYLYYKSREELEKSIFEYCFDLSIKCSLEGVENMTTYTEKLKLRIKNILVWSQKYPKESVVTRSYYKPVSFSHLEGAPFFRSYQINQEFIELGVQCGEFKDLPINMLCSLFFSAVEGLGIFYQKNGAMLEDENILDQALDSLLNLIRK